jgi:hypothetical protein
VALLPPARPTPSSPPGTRAGRQDDRGGGGRAGCRPDRYPDRYWDRRRALVAATGRDLPPLGADPLTGIVVGSVAAASVLAVAAGTVIRNQVEALAAATGVLFVPPPLAVLLSPTPVCLNAKHLYA